MNIHSHYCPVQASVDRYLSDCADAEAFDNAVEREKSDLWDEITAEQIADILSEVDYADAVFVDMRHVLSEINQSNRCNSERAADICRSLWGFVDDALDKEAERLVKKRIEDGQSYQLWCEERNHDH